ncbi:MAG: ABC-2 family transporter protein [Patescibacteria group bacterium]
MKKYFNIYKIFLNNAISYEAQYRRDTWLHLATNVLWVGLLATTIEVIFGQTKEIIGWTKPEMYLLTVVYVIMDEIYTMFFKKNMINMSELITQGELDLVLTKPASPLFLCTTKIVLIRALYRLGIQIGLLVWVLWHFTFVFSPTNVLIAFVLIMSGVAVAYAFVLILNTLSFWFLRFDNVNNAWDTLSSLGRYPVTVLPKVIQVILFTAVPIAFVGFVPTATLLGKWPVAGIFYALGFTGIIFFIAVRFWNFAVRRYSSASS